MTGVPLFLFAFPVNSIKMNGKDEGRWLATSPCHDESTVVLRANALRAYEGKSSELIPPGPRSRVGTIELGKFCLLPKRDLIAFRRPESTVLLLLV